MRVETKSGFSCEIDENVIDNYDFVDAVSQSDGNGIESVRANFKVFKAVFSDEDLQKLKTHCNNSFSKIVAETAEIIQILGEKIKTVKNS